MRFYIYILKSFVDNSFYIGYTSNIVKRIWEHNYGRTRYTKTRRPWALMYSESFSSRIEAIRRERYLKSLKSKKSLEKLISGPVAQR